MLAKAYIPYRGYYSTPFARWQGTMANEHAVVLGANTSRIWFAGKGWDPRMFDYGYARAKKAFMPASVPGAVKTHNPFIVNDINLAKQMGIHVDRINNYGSSLIFGHPQGPTAARLIIEGIEEVVMAGGGYLLFAGCSAGDSAASVVLRIN